MLNTVLKNSDICRFVTLPGLVYNLSQLAHFQEGSLLILKKKGSGMEIIGLFQ